MQRLTRRQLCGAAAAVTAGSLGGCVEVSSGGGEVSLFAGDEGLSEVFLLEGSYGAPNVARNAETLRATLRDTGSVETLEASLAGRVSHPDTSVPGETRPRFLAADGYHRLSLADATRTTVDEWVIWFETVAEAPSDARPVDALAAERGGLDAQILRRAKTAVGTALAADETPADRPPRDRGYVLFDPTTADDTELAPDPPFEYAIFEGEENFLPDEQPVRLRVERVAVETTRYTTTAQRVADDRAGFDDYLDVNVLDATFAAADLPGERREILDAAAGNGYREESATPSEPFRALLRRLGVETFEADDGFTRTVTYRYAGTVFGATYEID